jgi:hypothetical protein
MELLAAHLKKEQRRFQSQNQVDKRAGKSVNLPSHNNGDKQ